MMFPGNSTVSKCGMNRVLLLGLAWLGGLLPSTAWAQQALPELSLYIMDADGGNRRLLLAMDDFTSIGSPCFSPDGKKLAFDAWRSKQGENSAKAHILITNADGTAPKDLGDGAMPSWSPDGKQIVFTRYPPNTGVWLMNADGSKKELIDAQGWCGQWSPDGKKIAFTKYHRGGANLCIFDVNSKAQTFLFEWDEDTEPYRQIQWNFCWSPDSKRLCFKAQRKDGSYQVAIVSAQGQADGFKACFQPEKPAAEDLAWHPGGKKILVSMINTKQKNTRQLVVFDPDEDEAPKPIGHQSDEWANVNGSWTPDGKRIVFSSRKLDRK